VESLNRLRELLDDEDPNPTDGHSEEDGPEPLPVTVKPNHQETTYALQILLSLTKFGKHVYGGTVRYEERLRRRRRGRVAKQSRKTNR
jgi:hypothetical protein